MYTMTMYILYQETNVLTVPLLGWTAATFSSVVILFYLLTVILLRVLKIYFFWLQTLLYMLLSLIPVYMTTFLWVQELPSCQDFLFRLHLKASHY